MKTLKQQIEDMAAHVRDLASDERELVKALGDELRSRDEELLHAIRRMSAEHEQRRSLIMVELQALAERTRLLPQPGSGRDAAIATMQQYDQPAIGLYSAEGSFNLEKEVSYHLKRRAH